MIYSFAVILSSMMMGSTSGFVPSVPALINKQRTQLSATVTLDGKEIRGPITPLGNFVLIRSKESLSATDGGILLPDQVRSA